MNAASSIEGRTGNRAEVWLVEDNELFRRTTAALINAEDDLECTVHEASFERAAVSFDVGRVPDIVLLDIGLPGMDGIEAAARIRALSPTTRVIMLTVHDERDTVFEAIRAGASGYLLKSLSAAEIIAAIREVRAGGAPLNAHIARKLLDEFRAGDPAEYGLTPREVEVLELMVQGLTVPQLSDRLAISVHTIDSHVRNIYAKLHVRTRGSAVAKAIRERLV